jgi:hypothetical protein
VRQNNIKGGKTMKTIFTFLFALWLSLFLFGPVAASSDLDDFVRNLNVQAEADLGAFKVRLSSQFGLPVPRIDAVIASVATPADAYMCLRVGEVAHQPVEAVVKEYKATKGKGWGVIAKNLGIKPGSKEFHALKNGNLSTGGSEEDSGKGKGKGKGKK